jgi:hypothetical protein
VDRGFGHVADSDFGDELRRCSVDERLECCVVFGDLAVEVGDSPDAPDRPARSE